MTTLNSFEVNLLPRTDDHWDIVKAHYEAGQLHIEFKGGTIGSIATSRFPALASAIDTDYQDLQVSLSRLSYPNWFCSMLRSVRFIGWAWRFILFESGQHPNKSHKCWKR
jgi:hypothetical protein